MAGFPAHKCFFRAAGAAANLQLSSIGACEVPANGWQRERKVGFTEEGEGCQVVA